VADSSDAGKGREATVAVLASTVRTLPPLPGSVHELLKLNLSDPDLPEHVHDIVERDPALAVQVMKFANSAAFRGHGPIATLRVAIQRVGAPMIVGNVLQAAVHRVFDPYGGMGRRLGQIAILEANLMMALATVNEARDHIPPETAYLHGLLHDVGHLVMALKFGTELEAFRHRAIPAGEVARHETETFGFDHQQAGRLLANHWRLSDEITVVIASHHFPRELRFGQQDSTNRIIDMLGVTDRLSRMVSEDAGSREKDEAAVARWIVTPEARRLLELLEASPEQVTAAFNTAVGWVDRDRRMSANADTPNPS
jgi:HD-like signal output (HDOD) protein